MLVLVVLATVIPPTSAESTWSEKLSYWYGVMKDSQGLIGVLLGSCVLLALVLVVINLHIFSYRLQRQQYRFIARLNYLLDTRVVPTRSSITSDTRNSDEGPNGTIATV